jgi:outer membrane autotransporter protein
LTLAGASTATTGALIKLGDGTLTMNGVNLYTGDTTVNVGTLRGTGTISTGTGTLINNATVSPGNSPGIIGTLTAGDYRANAGSNTIIEVASGLGPGVGHSQIVATNAALGAITLVPGVGGATLTPTLLGGYVPPFNHVFANVLQATGVGATRVDTFTTVANAQITPTLFWQPVYNAASMDLRAAGNFNGAKLGLNARQMTVGNMLNGFAGVTGGDMWNVLNAITRLSTAGAVARAFDEILPLKYGSLPSLTFPNSRMQFQYLRNRMARLRQGGEFSGGEASADGGSFMRGFGMGYDTRMLLASNSVASDAGNPLIRRGMEQRWGVYLDPMVNWGNQDTVNGLQGYRYTNAGFTLGADYWLLENFLVGVNTGYNHTGTDIGGTGGSINVNSIPFNAYSSFIAKGFYANAILGYTHSDYDLERNIVFGTINRTAKASTSGNQFQLAAETGYDFKSGNAIFGPTFSLYYLTLTTDAFTENNAGALSLRVPSQTADSVQTGLGARAALKTKVGGAIVVPQVSAVWQHEYSDNTRSVNARLAMGSSTINFRTKEAGRDFAVLGADVSAKFSKNITGNVGYTAEVGRSHSTNMGVNVGLRIAF